MNNLNLAETLNQKFALLTESFLNTKQAPKHGNLVDAIQFVSQSFIQAGFPNNDYHTKGIKDVCLWVSLCFPHVEKNVYLIYSLLVAYLSVVDDACDREVDVTGMLRRELRDHEEFLEKNECDLSVIRNPSLKLALQIKNAVRKQFSDAKSERLIDGCKEFFKCSYSIAEMWVSGKCPSLETFEKIRQVDSMANILLEMSLVISTDDMAAPSSFFSNELSIHAYTLATRCCTIMNDVASLGKDIQDGISNNYVLLFAKENNLQMKEASILCIDRIMNSMKELNELSIDPIMKESMIAIVKGYSNWCAITPRFHHQHHPISYLAKVSSASSRLTSHENQVTYLDELNKNAILHPEPNITEPILLEKEKKPYFKDVFKGYSSLDLRVSYYSELLVNHALNLIPFMLCLAMNAGWVSLFSAFLIQQLATIVWTLSLHTLIHSHCKNTHVVDASDLILGLGYFGIFTPSIARYGHQTHHSQTETDQDFDFYFYSTNGIVKLLFKSTIFSEYYIMRYYQENKNTGKTTSILIAKFALMILLYTILGNNYLWILLFSRIASSYLFASFTTLVHSLDMIQFFNQIEHFVNNSFGCNVNMDTILELLFSYNIHVVKYHEYHHDYPWICPSVYCPTLTKLHPSSIPIKHN